MLTSLIAESIMAPGRVREIIVDKYSEYDFPLFAGSRYRISYAQGVDASLMDVPVNFDAPGSKWRANVGQ
jgi:hypothetical protein